MRKKSTCIRVQKQLGEKALALLDKMGLSNKTLEIQRDVNFLYIPLANDPSEEGLKALQEQMASFKILTRGFPERKKREVSIANLLADMLPPHLLASLPRGTDFVGNIAIIEIPPELDEYKNMIGEAILNANQKVRTVLAKAGAVSGTYRLRHLAVIAGEPNTETMHKEHGCQYYVDVAQAYFSPRLSHEHYRVASLAKEDETVVDLFAGVGPFAIQIAKVRPSAKVYAIDINPHAVEYLERNIRLNRVEGKVKAILGDARQVVADGLTGVADRVIMNLPETAANFVDVACEAIKTDGGIMHFYSFVTSSDLLEHVQLRFTKAVEKCGRKVERTLSSRCVRATAPHEWQAVLDVSIS